jgi:hypothetical protein
MSFFVHRGDVFDSTELTRGPWSPDHQHGGPPGALLVGRIAAGHPGRAVVRASIEFLRPVPIAPLRVEIDPPSGGRRVQRVLGRLVDLSGNVLCVAHALLVQSAPLDHPSLAAEGDDAPLLPDPVGGAPRSFPFFRWDTGYHTSMELRFAPGHFGAGPVRAWMRQRVPLVEGETPSPVERVFCAVDSVHGVSWRIDPREMSAVNSDLVVALHRMPEGEWVCLDAMTANEPSGVGVAHSRLWDTRGPLGWSLQSLVLTRVG